MIQLRRSTTSKDRDNDALRAAINEERDRRIGAGFVFAGHLFQYDARSKANITGTAIRANFAVLMGAQAGDLRWFSPAEDFGWVAADNTIVPMDAQTCADFCNAAAEHERWHAFRARELKDMSPIPLDYESDGYWTAQA